MKPNSYEPFRDVMPKEVEHVDKLLHTEKTYLGDSVYIECDGYNYILMNDNGYPDGPRNVIILEPEVVKALLAYFKL